MRNPIPTNRLVAFTLAGALLTTIVAGGLAFPGIGPTADSATETGSETAEQLAADAPEPNQNFTPAVQTESSYEEHEEHEEEEHEEYEEDEDHEGEEEEYEDDEHED